jgi:hypothetical protein
MAIEYVNSTSNYATGLTNNIASPALSCTTGNLIIVQVRTYNDKSATISSITDTAGNTYTQIGFNNTYRQWMYYAYNITGNASNVVTVTFNTTTDFRGIGVSQYSGAKTSATPLVSSTVTATTTASSITSATFNTTAGQAIISCGDVNSDGSNWTAGANFTIRLNPASGSTGSQDRITTTDLTGTSSTMSWNKSVIICMITAVFSPGSDTINITDTLSLSETSTYLRSLTHTATDNISLTETISVLKVMFLEVMDTLHITEAITGVRSFVANIVDTLGLSELFTFKKKWTNQTKNTSTFTNKTKNTSTWTNRPKN